jgi:hypothetical protein
MRFSLRCSPVTGAGTSAGSDLASRATSAVATDAGTQAGLQLIHRPYCAMQSLTRNSVALVWRTRLEFTMAAAHRSLWVDLRRSVQ